jgi:hypothetical protein
MTQARPAWLFHRKTLLGQLELPMRQITFRVAAIKQLLDGIQDAATIIERAALFSAIRFLIEDLCRDEIPNSYAHEKAYKLSAHIGAMLGFDEDYGMRPASHFTAASVELASLESALLQHYR